MTLTFKGESMNNKNLISPLKDDGHLNKLFDDVVQLIQQGQAHAAKEVKSTIVLLYWSIGKRINDEVLLEKRANYGSQIVDHISLQLSTQFGRGYNRSSLFRMVSFAKCYADYKIVATLSRQLSWSHIVFICQIEDELKRDFYLQMACVEKWTVRTLRDKWKTMLFERTAISKKPEIVIKTELEKLQQTKQLTPDLVFRDPCFFDFIGLDSKYSELDLEPGILDHIVEFIQEIGSDFCFVARQKKMSTQKTDRYLDLLFFRRTMRRLIAVELKLGRFEPEHKGQMEWYLRWLDKHERKNGEEKPFGIILCADKDQEDVEYLELDQAGIHVAQFLTELPPKKLLEEKLHRAIAVARQRYDVTMLNQSQ